MTHKTNKKFLPDDAMKIQVCELCIWFIISPGLNIDALATNGVH